MLTRFFGKSNPINFLILSVAVLITYIATVVPMQPETVTFTKIPFHGLLIMTVVFSVFLLDFLIRKNSLTRVNTYAVLVYVCFLCALPVVYTVPNIVFASVLLLLAYRRVISVSTGKNIEKKILDASLYISVAGLFYFWAVLFFLVLYLAIARRAILSFRLLFIPLAGLFAVATLCIAYCLLAHGSLGWLVGRARPVVSFYFLPYNPVGVLVPLAVLLSLLLWSGIWQLLSLAAVQKKDRFNTVLLLFTLAVCICIALVGPDKTGAELLFVFVPFSLVATKYIESIKERLFKEAMLWLVVLMPFIVLFF